MRLFFILFLISQFINSQNQLEGIILDSATNNPVEFVDIYNVHNYTTTNTDGSFLFTSEGDSIIIKKLGYQTIHSTFQLLHKRDTIFLNETSFKLDEIVLIEGRKQLIDALSTLDKQYSYTTYEELFTMRALLKKNDSILKLEDLSGKLKRKQLFSTEQNKMPNRNYKVELLNLRKAGLKEQQVDFIFNSFKQIFDWMVSIAINDKIYEINTEPIEDNITKIHFRFKDSISQLKNEINEGYYVFDSKNRAILEAKRKIEAPISVLYKSKDYFFRTTYFDLNSFFQKNEDGKYFLKNARISAKVEVINAITGKVSMYTCVYILTTQDNFKKLNTKANVSVKKDIFRIEYPYNPDFWEKQNQLLLTEEMLDFLKTVKDENNEYRSISNFKN
ncbi:hypothetical protein [Joostella sp.]|uniref:hypothetical protein n=1 Tax=Joostella sp. TaxID=2231138 RepID=UPI003A93B586